MQLYSEKLKFFFLSLRSYSRPASWSLMAVSLCAALGSCVFFFSKADEWSTTQKRLHQIHARSEKREKEKKSFEALSSKHRQSDPHYISTVLQTQSLSIHPVAQEKISSSDWPFHFKEMDRASYAEGEEILWSLETPVYMNEEDLKKILSLIEGVSIGKYRASAKRPWLLIPEFTLEIVELPTYDSVYRVHFNLIQRNFIRA